MIKMYIARIELERLVEGDDLPYRLVGYDIDGNKQTQSAATDIKGAVKAFARITSANNLGSTLKEKIAMVSKIVREQNILPHVIEMELECDHDALVEVVKDLDSRVKEIEKSLRKQWNDGR